ncbi:hypothetical protein KFK09_018675 [Dendrobium nobile]|uniref:PDZ domain-containing protein n=1 Tax=Dendrobium nobile TaxID=94219 RepID=A0A8T3AVG0_DENNO|nr:hypothetical protein KFK09_018675 [Dendrobium nobile]
MAYYLGSNLQCRMCGFRGRRKHFKLLKVPHKASLIQRLQTLFSASPKILSSYILSFQRKVQKVTCWQEKFIISIGTIFSWLVVSMMLITSASVTVSKDSTYMAIKKMLSTLDDPFTRFLEPEKFKVLRSGTQGALTGVGLSIGYPPGLTYHCRTSCDFNLSRWSANKIGIKPGDVILAIDDRSTEDMDIYEAAELLHECFI